MEEQEGKKRCFKLLTVSIGFTVLSILVLLFIHIVASNVFGGRASLTMLVYVAGMVGWYYVINITIKEKLVKFCSACENVNLVLFLIVLTSLIMFCILYII